MNVHSVSAELATVARKARGLVPPKLVVSGLLPDARSNTDSRLGRVHDGRRGQDVSVCERSPPDLSGRLF
jgi:hypothetical protein